MSWFTSLGQQWQHLLVGLSVTALTWLGTEEVPVLQQHNPLVAGIVGTLATLLLGYLTPGVPYGLGNPDGERRA